MSVDSLAARSGGVIGTIGPIGGSGVFSLQERYALTADNYEDVSLYLKMNGANGSTTFYDSSLYGHTVTANGNAQISTAQSKFGGASAAFDGTGDYLSIASSPEFDLGTGDFTFETWIYKTKPGNANLFHGTTTGLIINIDSSEKVVVRLFGVADRLTSSEGLSSNQWNHVAVARGSGTLSIWINGSRSSGGTIANSDNFAQTGFNVAANDSNIAVYGGYLSNLRLVKGVAVYDPNSETFTPPQREFRP